MCQAKVFLMHDGTTEMVAKDVTRLEESAEGITLSTFFDEPILVAGRITAIDFLKHTVTLMPLEEGARAQ